MSLFSELRDGLRLLSKYRYRWMLPAAVTAALTLAVVLLTPPQWEASQALMVRSEASNNPQSPGKFLNVDEMKAIQETMMELVFSRRVLEAALAQVGPGPAGRTWKSAGEQDYEALRRAIRLVPPRGAEFGKTEVFYLKVRDPDRDRATALTQAICDQSQLRYQELRDAKARSMIDELSKTADIARADLDQSTARVCAIETKAGSDLAELRALTDAATSDSPLRRTLGEVHQELRQAQDAVQADQELLTSLRAAKSDSSRLVATPNRLLESQPALRRLKEGLVDAQIRSAGYQGRMVDAHPLVRAAKESEREIAQHLHNEIDSALRGGEIELRLHADRVALLESKRDKVSGRLAELAAIRAEYVRVLGEMKHRESIVHKAQQDLAEARGVQAAAKASSLIARIDAPDPGSRPVGLAAASTLLFGSFGGLVLGLGVLALTVSGRGGVPAHERWSPLQEEKLLVSRDLSLRDVLRRRPNGTAHPRRS